MSVNDRARQIDDEAQHVVNAEVALAGAERLAFFSDAVVAIAVTLLALELPVPSGGTNAAILRSLGEHSMEYLAFFISFLVIVQHWIGHHKLLGAINRLGGRLVGFNMVWLLMIVLTPFATKILTEGENGGFQVQFGMYALIQMLSGITFGLMAREIDRNGLLRPEASRQTVIRSYRVSLALALTFGLSIPMVAVLHQFTYLIWILMPIITRVVRRFVRGEAQPEKQQSHVTG